MPDDIVQNPPAPQKPADRTAQLERELADVRAALAESERMRLMHAALLEARAVDVDAAAALVREALGEAGNAGIGAAVRDLKRRKPHLFRAVPATGSMAAAIGAPGSGATTADDLAAAARATGDRRTLLDYLRARRVGGR